MIMNSIWRTLIITLLLSGPFIQARAAVLRWTLNDVVFSDGGQASGYFDIDATLMSMPSCEDCVSRSGMLDWNITVSGGEEYNFPNFSFTPNSSWDEVESAKPPRFPGTIIIFHEKRDNDTPERIISFYLASPLTNEGGEIPLIQIDSGVGSGECFNCNPYRKIVSGTLTASPAPINAASASDVQKAVDVFVKVAAKRKVPYNKPILYKLTVGNKSVRSAKTIVISNQLTNDVTFIKFPKQCAVSGRDLDCFLDSLPGKSKKQLKFKAISRSQGILTNDVTVYSQTPDSNIYNNKASPSVSIK